MSEAKRSIVLTIEGGVLTGVSVSDSSLEDVDVHLLDFDVDADSEFKNFDMDGQSAQLLKPPVEVDADLCARVSKAASEL